MSFYSFILELPFLKFGVKKQENYIKLNEGETILVRCWSWKKMGHTRKAYSMKDGVTTMEKLD